MINLPVFDCSLSMIGYRTIRQEEVAFLLANGKVRIANFCPVLHPMDMSKEMTPAELKYDTYKPVKDFIHGKLIGLERI